MNAYLFNACLAVGWLLCLIGGCLVSVPYGLLLAGALLLVLTVMMARLGGIYVPKGAD